MPGFDRTGPRGQGPMTGGGFGYCTEVEPFPERTMLIGRRNGCGRGFSGRGGRGQGFRFRSVAVGPNRQPYEIETPEPGSLTKEQEVQILEEQKKSIEADLAKLNKKLEEIKSKGE